MNCKHFITLPQFGGNNGENGGWGCQAISYKCALLVFRETMYMSPRECSEKCVNFEEKELGIEEVKES